jgi:phosphinothricin acetyltransferase
VAVLALLDHEVAIAELELLVPGEALLHDREHVVDQLRAGGAGVVVVLRAGREHEQDQHALHAANGIMPPMTIRAAVEHDFDAIAAITNHYIEATAVHFAYEAVAPNTLRTTWQASRDRYPWFVAEADGRVIGYAKAGMWRERDAYRWTCELGIYLAPEQRGRRLGSELYSALLDECQRCGFRTLIAGITLPNPTSLALHQRLGFETAGVIRDAGYKLGKWHDVAFFQKRFPGSPEPPRP